MKFIIGKKLGMTQKFGNDGLVIPVTKIQAGPCVVVQVKDEKKNGYRAVQVGFGEAKKVNKPMHGHVKELGKFRILKEFRCENDEELSKMSQGKKITCNVFTVGEKISVTGISKGKGFQGVVKRWNFSGSPASHGHKDQLRMPGSSGAGGVQHVLKGKKMPGRMGNDQITIKNLEVVEIDLQNNIVFVKGAVPGSTGNFVWLTGDGTMNISEVKDEKQENIKETNEEKSLESEVAVEVSASDKSTMKQE